VNLTKEIELLMHITSKYISVEEDEINVKRKTGEQVMARKTTR
jgi:septum formation topological specificity factor MinE